MVCGIGFRSVLFLISVSVGCLVACPDGLAQDRHIDDGSGTDPKQQIADLGSPNPAIRGLAACKLGEAGMISAVEPLTGMLSDSAPIDVVSCGNRGKFSSYEPPGSSSPGTEAARSLGSIGKQTSERGPLLFRLFETLRSGTPHASENAALALGIIGDPVAVDPLLGSVADQDVDESVRLKSIWALAAIKDPKASLAFISALSDESPAIREKAAWALSVVRDKRALLSLSVASADDEAAVRERAVYALSTYHSRKVVNPLLEALGDEQATVREKAAWGLGTVKAPEAVTPLIHALADRSTSVRQRAAWALGVLKDERALPALQNAAGDSDPKVRKLARESIRLIESEISEEQIGN